VGEPQGPLRQEPLRRRISGPRQYRRIRIGASHQTGWTGIVATLIELFGKFDGQALLQAGREAVLSPEEERA
jgi:hypothetical protein